MTTNVDILALIIAALAVAPPIAACWEADDTDALAIQLALALDDDCYVLVPRVIP